MGILPLYAEAVQTQSSERMDNESKHHGLLFDKYFDKWDNTWGQKTDSAQVTKWLNTFCASPIGSQPLIDEYLHRQQVAVERLGGALFTLENTSTFITGIGRNHPVNHGFLWHSTLGTPYLPGSSVKGLARSWATNWDSGVTVGMIDRIFGSIGQEKPSRGGVIFFDMIPIRPLRIKLDVLTPHFGEYYMDGASPGDWLAPVPVQFLAVAPNQSFQLALLPATKDHLEDLTTACDLIANSFESIGAGAKTSSGYGRFSVQKPKPKPVEEAPELIFIKWFDAQRFSANNKGRHNEIIQKISELCGEEARSAAIKHALLTMNKRNSSSSLWTFLKG